LCVLRSAAFSGHCLGPCRHLSAPRSVSRIRGPGGGTSAHPGDNAGFPPFQEGKLHEATSPIGVTVSGQSAEVLNALGWPTMNNIYRVDFIVPAGIETGMANIGLSVAWIKGPEVKIGRRRSLGFYRRHMDASVERFSRYGLPDGDFLNAEAGSV